jgi:D-alanyl-lipoteichoic acid acyltransferase DltB (MBOAT superfamily)
MVDWSLLAEIIVYLVLARCCVVLAPPSLRAPVFGVINLLFFFLLFHPPQETLFNSLLIFALYAFIVSIQFLALNAFASSDGFKPWIAFSLPLLFLFCVKYLDRGLSSLFVAVTVALHAPPGVFFVGLSYLAFRSSYLVLEVRNKAVQAPTYFEYLAFCFFVPTASIGPISPFSKFRESFYNPSRSITPSMRSFARIAIGLGKYYFLGALFNQLTYAGLLADGNPHNHVDLLIAAVAYYFYIFCNFSGFCDMAIGAAGLIGIVIVENFDNPFAARNVREFWNRWHITLSHYLRDVVFAPLSKGLTRLFGVAGVNHAIAIAIFVVFLLVGVWHGLQWNYFLFGALHAAALVIHHYYSLTLKAVLGRNGFLAYNSNPWIKMAAMALTFCFITFSFFVFANDGPMTHYFFFWGPNAICTGPTSHWFCQWLP